MISSNMATCEFDAVDLASASRELQNLCECLEKDPAIAKRLNSAIHLCVKSLRAGGTIFFCGNGGSAADSQHLAGELVSRFLYDRPGLRGVALNADLPPRWAFIRSASQAAKEGIWPHSATSNCVCHPIRLHESKKYTCSLAIFCAKE